MSIEEFYEELTHREKDEVMEALSKLRELESGEISEVQMAALFSWRGWR